MSYPTAIDGYDGGKDAESRASDGAGFFAEGVAAEVRLIVSLIDIVPIIFRLYGIVAFTGQAADGVGVVPEIAKCLALDDVEESGVGQTFDDADGGDAVGAGSGGKLPGGGRWGGTGDGLPGGRRWGGLKGAPLGRAGRVRRGGLPGRQGLG